MSFLQSLTLYSTLFFQLYENFLSVCNFYVPSLYPILLTFVEFLGKILLSFIGHFFEDFRKSTSIFYWALFLNLDEAFRTFSLCNTPPSSIGHFFAI